MVGRNVHLPIVCRDWQSMQKDRNNYSQNDHNKSQSAG